MNTSNQMYYAGYHTQLTIFFIFAGGHKGGLNQASYNIPELNSLTTDVQPNTEMLLEAIETKRPASYIRYWQVKEEPFF